MQAAAATGWAEGMPEGLVQAGGGLSAKQKLGEGSTGRSVVVNSAKAKLDEEARIKQIPHWKDQGVPPGYVRVHTGGEGDGLRFVTATDTAPEVAGEYLGGLSVAPCAARCGDGCAGFVYSEKGSCQLVSRILQTTTEVDAVSYKRVESKDTLAGAAMERARRQVELDVAQQSGDAAAITAAARAVAAAQAEEDAAKRLMLRGVTGAGCTEHGAFNSTWYLEHNPELKAEVELCSMYSIAFKYSTSPLTPDRESILQIERPSCR